MGQKMSVEERRSVKREMYSNYPGLEQQLDMAFACHDFNGQGRLPYTTLEPAIRHLLMQYGLIEYVTRFSDNEGRLDADHVRQEMRDFNIQDRTACGVANLGNEEFKSLAVIWLKKIWETHAEDQAEWMEKLRSDQEEQGRKYAEAMKKFEEQYITQQALYRQGLNEQQKQIEEWNKLLEDTQKTQQEVYEAEVRRMQEVEEREANRDREALLEQQRIVLQYQQQLAEIAKEDSSGRCFVYPATATPYGACASAGAQEPARRPSKPRVRDSSKKGIRSLC